MIATATLRRHDAMAKKRANKGGRPPLPEDERLAKGVTVRFTDEHFGLMERAAEAKGVTIRAFLREAGVDAARRVLGE